jgi:hypothetical protein
MTLGRFECHGVRRCALVMCVHLASGWLVRREAYCGGKFVSLLRVADGQFKFVRDMPI